MYGSKEHREFKCPDRVDTDDRDKEKSSTKRVTLETSKFSKRQKTSIDWNRYTRREGRDTEDDDADEVYLLMSDSYNNDNEVNMAEDDEYVYLDSCGQSCLESFVYSSGSIYSHHPC